MRLVHQRRVAWSPRSTASESRYFRITASARRAVVGLAEDGRSRSAPPRRRGSRSRRGTRRSAGRRRLGGGSDSPRSTRIGLSLPRPSPKNRPGGSSRRTGASSRTSRRTRARRGMCSSDSRRRWHGARDLGEPPEAPRVPAARRGPSGTGAATRSFRHARRPTRCGSSAGRLPRGLVGWHENGQLRFERPLVSAERERCRRRQTRPQRGGGVVHRMIGRREPLPRIRIVEIERLPGDPAGHGIRTSRASRGLCRALTLDVVVQSAVGDDGDDVPQCVRHRVVERPRGERRPDSHPAAVVGELAAYVAGVPSGISPWPDRVRTSLPGRWDRRHDAWLAGCGGGRATRGRRPAAPCRRRASISRRICRTIRAAGPGHAEQEASRSGRTSGGQPAFAARGEGERLQHERGEPRPRARPRKSTRAERNLLGGDVRGEDAHRLRVLVPRQDAMQPARVLDPRRRAGCIACGPGRRRPGSAPTRRTGRPSPAATSRSGSRSRRSKPRPRRRDRGVRSSPTRGGRRTGQ